MSQGKENMSSEDFLTIEENFSADQNRINNHSLIFKNKIFKEEFGYGGDAPIIFENCDFLEAVTFLGYHPTSNVYLQNCVFERNLVFLSVNISGKISFLNCTIKSLFLIAQSKINELQFNVKYCHNLQFDNNSLLDRVDIGGMHTNVFGEIYLFSNIIKTRFTIDNIESQIIRLPYSTLSNELNILNTKVNSFEIENLRNNGSLRFMNLSAIEIDEKPSRFTISRSNLGQAEFYNFNFASFEKVNVINSILMNSLFVGSKWTRNIESVDLESPIKMNNYLPIQKAIYSTRLREVYKQIKLALSKQGNFIEEQYFHGLEMNEYFRSINWKSHFWTKAILRLSYYFSDYGQSVWRPIFILLVLNGTLYAVLQTTLRFQLVGLNQNFASALIDTVANFMWYQNPLHKIQPEFAGLPLIIDILMRVISSYCIYNFIRASRRFIK